MRRLRIEDVEDWLVSITFIAAFFAVPIVVLAIKECICELIVYPLLFIMQLMILITLVDRGE